MIVDILGREVKIGDIVVSTNNSSSYSQIHVVTRLGSTDRIQVNGCSYLMAEYMMICTEQYTIAKGEEETKKLIAKYAEFFEEKPVEKKLPSPKFLVIRYKPYGESLLKPRYFVVKVQGNGQECNKQIQEFFEQFDLSAFGQYFDRKSLNKKSSWTYSDLNQAKTMKELKALGLDQVVDCEIVETDLEYNVVQSFR